MNVFFCGTGGTGKTTMLEPVAKALGLPVQQSIVRDFYKSQDIVSQKHLDNLPPSTRASFQLDLMRHYLFKVESFKAQYPQGFIMDRSIYDHAAYAMLSSLDSDKYYVDCVKNMISKVQGLGDSIIVYFPYPSPWLNAVHDGFRNVRAAHDTLHDAFLCKCISDRANMIYAPAFPAEERANYIVRQIKYMGNTGIR